MREKNIIVASNLGSNFDLCVFMYVFMAGRVQRNWNWKQRGDFSSTGVIYSGASWFTHQIDMRKGQFSRNLVEKQSGGTSDMPLFFKLFVVSSIVQPGWILGSGFLYFRHLSCVSMFIYPTNRKSKRPNQSKIGRNQRGASLVELIKVWNFFYLL